MYVYVVGLVPNLIIPKPAKMAAVASLLGTRYSSLELLPRLGTTAAHFSLYRWVKYSGHILHPFGCDCHGDFKFKVTVAFRNNIV